jgi:predicted small metal-binding protein
MKKFECKSLGMECPFSASSENMDEIIQRAEEHAASAHGMTAGEETRNKIKAAITDAV